MASPIYMPRDQDARKEVAARCQRGSNSRRDIIAAEIVAGDLFFENGMPKTYWHCLATLPPPTPSERGQWKATPGNDPWDGANWFWQSWT